MPTNRNEEKKVGIGNTQTQTGTLLEQQVIQKWKNRKGNEKYNSKLTFTFFLAENYSELIINLLIVFAISFYSSKTTLLVINETTFGKNEFILQTYDCVYIFVSKYTLDD